MKLLIKTFFPYDSYLTTRGATILHKEQDWQVNISIINPVMLA